MYNYYYARYYLLTLGACSYQPYPHTSRFFLISPLHPSPYLFDMVFRYVPVIAWLGSPLPKFRLFSYIRTNGLTNECPNAPKFNLVVLAASLFAIHECLNGRRDMSSRWTSDIQRKHWIIHIWMQTNIRLRQIAAWILYRTHISSPFRIRLLFSLLAEMGKM